MTVIAWDGQILASDKRATSEGLIRTVTKIWKIDGLLVGGCGDFVTCCEMREWIKRGRNHKDFPEMQRDKEDWAKIIVIDQGAIQVYERSPYPVIFEDRHFAVGTGRDFALSAMYLGKSAKVAVEIANHFECYCGNGVDFLELE